MVENLKIAPNSKESEMMVLGSMLTSVNSLNVVADLLEERDFYYSEHKIIFRILKVAYKKDSPADVHLVAEELKRQEKLQEIGGVSYLTTLAQYAGTSAFVEEYAKLIRDKSILRQMIEAAEVIERTALQDPDDVHAALDDAQAKFFQISQAVNRDPGIQLKELISGEKAFSKMPYLKLIEEKQEQYRTKGPGETNITGVPTHFIDLDRLINGMNPSNLVILAARPAMGKTALALNIAENICFKNSLPVGVFSLEMSSEQVLHRIICSQSEVEAEKIKTGSLDGHEYQRIVSSVNKMIKHSMVIDDQPGLKITDLRARARRMKEVYGIEFLVIDYLQLISGSGSFRSYENRQNEISEISRMLKNLARELNISVLCLSQLSRKVEERQGHRPMMSDLRESGCLSGDTLIQDAESGKLHTIKGLAERTNQEPFFVFGVDEHLKLGKYRLLKAFYSGKKKVYELKTRSGRFIKASLNHPFLKIEGWVSLDKLKVKDKIALPAYLTINKQLSSRREYELILLAHLLGDGCILPRQPYHYTSADTENLEVVEESVRNLFNIKPRLIKQKNWYHLYFPSPYKLTHNRYHPITNWFNKLAISRVRSYDKVIPSMVFERSEDEISIFLKHLWSTDGNISLKKLQGRKESAAIYYGTSSEILSKQVQHLLLRLNVQSTITTHSSLRGYRNMYHVNVQGSGNQKIFLSRINSHGKRGRLQEELLYKLNQIVANQNLDVIPKEVWEHFVIPAKKRSNLSWRDICSKLNMSYCGSSLFKHGVSKKKMNLLYNILQDKKLLELAQSDLYWDEVVSIEELDVQDVYDATIEGVHNFIANDILVHNSIEQDADVVMLLLRREYYADNDHPGQAEIIIGKNRHGPIGSVNLTFRKEITQFANFAAKE